MRAAILQKIEALSREIRNYPTPIARCDEQLTALLEARTRLLQQLNDIQETPGGCTPLGLWTNDGGFDAA